MLHSCLLATLIPTPSTAPHDAAAAAAAAAALAANIVTGTLAPTCPRCPGAVPETAEHVLLDCPAYAHLRSDPRHACFFQQTQPPPQPTERLRVFTSQQPQTRLASFVHSCFEQHSQPL